MWNFALSRPKPFGRTESRPIAYSRREALACAARPEANWPRSGRPGRRRRTAAADVAIGGRGGRVLEHPAGVEPCHVGHDHEDPAADQGDEHDRAGHVLARVDGLLGERGDGVEPEERVRGYGGAGGDGGEAGGVVEERVGADQRTRAGGGDQVPMDSATKNTMTSS